ncbi:TFIIH/NER complex subunit TFB4 [Sugiyamaella lignohabitans]|uniref:General transcription and DNA repair factor IIH subunit TFB4 n=1 Tax=Sugiyamaella lignohabitans TaxID=796027 RepID=A0A167EB47_9ASCO|nr:TFIIH/NER complex subunit TFB4 [Sugiyamaella lignohabitans]ANB13856.1 TFIIH/NER complex subunit TFB4 [Sugiyamaella lignohabitans]
MNAVDDTHASLGGSERTGSDEHPTLLGIVLDTNPTAWAELENKLSLKEAVESLLIFINAHLSLNNANRVAVIAAHTTGAKFLYPKPPSSSFENGSQSGHTSLKAMSGTTGTANIFDRQTMYRQFREVDEAVVGELDRLVSSATEKSVRSTQSAVSGALSLALTYINRVNSNEDEVKTHARILLVSVSGDLSSQYIPTMNCIFAAQKKRIPIDVCKLAGDTVFLQQASDSTNGTYMKLDHPRGLVQYLLSAFLVDPAILPHVNLSTQRDVDFRAACFVTKTVVDIGCVCSVCLCIMSKVPADGSCPMCGTVYDPQALQKINRKPMVIVKKKPKKKKAKLDSTPVGTPSPIP